MPALGHPSFLRAWRQGSYQHAVAEEYLALNNSSSVVSKVETALGNMLRVTLEDLAQRSWGTYLQGLFSIGVLLLLFSLTPWLWFDTSLVNNRKRFEILWTNATRRFQVHGKTILEEGFAKYGDYFYAVTDFGPHLILSPKYVDEIRNDHRLCVDKYFEQALDSHIGGFELFQVVPSDMKIFHDGIQNHLTRILGNLLQPLSVEADDALRKHWTDRPEWHELPLYDTSGTIMGQVSARALAGEQLCRDPAWLEGSGQYTRNLFTAGAELRLWPRFLRPLVAKFMPQCRRLHQNFRDVQKTIMPVVEQRRAEKEAMLAQGKTPKRHLDLLECMDNCANGRPYDVAVAQLKGVAAAVGSIQELLTQAVFNICSRPSLMEDLRKEIIEVIGRDGLVKTSLHKLHLLDSVLKETLRLKPSTICPMMRVALQPITLSDGLKIPKGTMIYVSCHSMWDEKVYPNADQFDGYRFYKMRQISGQNNKAHLVSTSSQFLGFGHGKHACPGRFLGETSLKLILCHMLLKYNMKLVEGSEPKTEQLGIMMLTDLSAPIAIQRRQEEVKL
ncbi:cytochrome P450 [Aspergillus aurantiobrunneus]